MNKLRDIKKAGDEFIGFALIRESTLGKTVGGDNFLTLLLVDSDSSIEAKLWNCAEEDAYVFCNKELVKVKGDVVEFRGQLQIKIELIRLVEERDGVAISDYIPKAPEDIGSLVKELEDNITSIQTPILKEITLRLYDKYKDKIISHPAATKNHHNYYAGLLYHIVSMMRQAKYLTKQYKLLNLDLLLSGIFVHDIAKVEELSDPIAPEYTRKRLIGHIALGMIWVDREVQQLKKDGREVSEAEEMLIEELLHLQASHHGDVSLGWGSVVSPMTLEAKFLHQIDKTDADHEMIRAGLDNKEHGEFHKIWPVGTFLKK